MHITHTQDWLSMECMQDGELYEVHGRNCQYAIWDAGHGGFLYWRHKFGQRFFDCELHYDEGPPHGTCKPIRRLTW